jgi:hypothetical protein
MRCSGLQRRERSSRRCCHRANYCFPTSAGNESNYRTSAYEAITSFVQQATVDCVQVVSSTTLKILDRMEHLLNVQVRHRRI